MFNKLSKMFKKKPKLKKKVGNIKIGREANKLVMEGPGVASMDPTELLPEENFNVEESEPGVYNIEDADQNFCGRMHHIGDKLVVELPPIMEADKQEYFLGALTLAAPLIQQGLKMMNKKKDKTPSGQAPGKIGGIIQMVKTFLPLLQATGLKQFLPTIQSYLDKISPEAKTQLADEFWKGACDEEYMDLEWDEDDTQ